MKPNVFVRRPVVTSISIVAATMVAIGTACAAAVLEFGFDPPNSFGGITTVVSILVGAGWFRSTMHRAMSKRERLGFATGVALLNAIVPLASIAALLLWTGLPLSIASFDQVLEGGKGTLLQSTFAWLMLFVIGVVFVGAYFAAGRVPRKQRERGEAA